MDNSICEYISALLTLTHKQTNTFITHTDTDTDQTKTLSVDCIACSIVVIKRPKELTVNQHSDVKLVIENKNVI